MIDLYGKDLLCTQDWSKEDLLWILELATKMKRERFHPSWQDILKFKSFLMLFYSPSIRTHLSFTTALTELGGHAEYLSPSTTRFHSVERGGEQIEDVAKVIARYMAGIGVRIMEDKLPFYGAGQKLTEEFASWADVPVINMANDCFHPCQGLADILGWAEWWGNGKGFPDFEKLAGKNLLLTWSKGSLARTWCSVQEALLVASRFGMNITIAHPEGYALDPNVCMQVQENCNQYGGDYRILNDPDSGYAGAHVVYSRNWVSSIAYQNGALQKQQEIEKALTYQDWTTTAERMLRTDNAIFTHPMPVDRGQEVENTVASGARSAIYDIAENRLHVQKAILASTMSEKVLEQRFL